MVTVTFAAVHCFKCGVLFGVPKVVDDDRQRSHRRFFCINGHEQYYLKPTPADKPLAERQAEILALHEAEQAEARAAEGKTGPVEPPAAPPAADNLACPHCGKVYKSSLCYRKHLRREHEAA